MQGLRSLGQAVQLSLEDFRESVEQPPCCSAIREFGMAWLSPFVENVRQFRDWQDLPVNGSDDQVVGLCFGKFGPPISGEPFFLASPHTTQQADRTSNQLRQVTFDVDRVLAGQFDFAREGKVVAHKDTGSHDH